MRNLYANLASVYALSSGLRSTGGSTRFGGVLLGLGLGLKVGSEHTRSGGPSRTLFWYATRLKELTLTVSL